MKSNYKKLGEYIRQIDIRNKDLKVSRLLGVSIRKSFIESIANTVGTNFSNYKVVRKGQFAYGPVTSRNGEKISVALLEEDECIISSSYMVFEIVNVERLLPEYLMLWFRRPEFDRYARYKSHGSVREIFDWSELCNTYLPVPTLEEQRKIVKNYKVITDRILIKQKINDNLMAVISALFIKLYDRLDDDSNIPLGNICTLTSSKRVFADDYATDGIPFYRGKEITLKQSGQMITEPFYIEKSHFEELKRKYGIPSQGDILITAVGTIGNSYLVQNEEFYFKDGNIIWLKNFLKDLNYYVYDFMQTSIFKQLLEGICIGSTQTALTIEALSKIAIKIADESQIAHYNVQSKVLHSRIERNSKEIFQLYELQAILLAELSR